MSILTGAILAREEIIKGGHDKTVITLKMPDSQGAFIEFRGSMMMEVVKTFRDGDMVRVAVSFEAKTARNSGIRFNNIVAKSIETL